MEGVYVCGESWQTMVHNATLVFFYIFKSTAWDFFSRSLNDIKNKANLIFHSVWSRCALQLKSGIPTWTSIEENATPKKTAAGRNLKMNQKYM